MITHTTFENGLWIIHVLINGEPEQAVSRRSYLEALCVALKLIFVHSRGVAA